MKELQNLEKSNTKNNFYSKKLVFNSQLIHSLSQNKNTNFQKESILFFPPLSANEPYTEKASAKYSQVNGYAKNWINKKNLNESVLKLKLYDFYSLAPLFGNSYLENSIKEQVFTHNNLNLKEQKKATCFNSVKNIADFINKNNINVRAIAGASFGGSSLITALSTTYFKKHQVFKDISGGGVLDDFSKRFYLIQILLQNPSLYYETEPDTKKHYEFLEELVNTQLLEINSVSIEAKILKEFFKDFFLKRLHELISQFSKLPVFDLISKEARLRDDLFAIYAREFAFIGGYINLEFYSRYVKVNSLSDYSIDQNKLFSWFDPSPKDGTRAEQYIREMHPKALALLCKKNINSSFFVSKNGEITGPNTLSNFAKNIKKQEYLYNLNAVELDSLFSASTVKYFIEELKKKEELEEQVNLKVFTKKEVPLQITHGHDTFLGAFDICGF